MEYRKDYLFSTNYLVHVLHNTENSLIAALLLILEVM